MNKFSKLFGLGIASAAVILFVGCTTMPGKTASATKEKAILCDKCETVWISKPQHIGKATVYRRGEKMACEGCNTAVQDFLKTGKLAENCKTCGGNLTVCAPHTEAIQLTEPSSAPAVKEDQVFTCTKCKTVWVRNPQQIGKATVYRTQKKVVCPDCESAVMNFFKTGKLEHTCKACGDHLNQCAMCK